MIRNITVIVREGIKQYEVGQDIGDKMIEKIVKEGIHFTGDPFDHYVGYDVSGHIIFSVNCLVPCVVEYL